MNQYYLLIIDNKSIEGEYATKGDAEKEASDWKKLGRKATIEKRENADAFYQTIADFGFQKTESKFFYNFSKYYKYRLEATKRGCTFKTYVHFFE